MKEGKITWSKEVLYNKFSSEIKGYHVSINFDDPNDKFIKSPEDVIYQLDLIDKDGDVFDSIKVRSEIDTSHSLLESLYNKARRSAKGIDAKISDILSGLK